MLGRHVGKRWGEEGGKGGVGGRNGREFGEEKWEGQQEDEDGEMRAREVGRGEVMWSDVEGGASKEVGRIGAERWREV